MLTGKKAQTGMMEYIVLTFFIIVVLIAIMFFLFGFQVAQFSIEKQSSKTTRALQLASLATTHPLFVKEDGMLDDAKLTSLATLEDPCSRLEEIFGSDFFIEISAFDAAGTVPCSRDTYPSCNYWAFCMKEKRFISFDVPVNVYRNADHSGPSGPLSAVDIGLLRVGIYAE